MATTNIEGWLCAETDSLRVASHGEQSASYADDVLLASEGKIPKAVLAWLLGASPPLGGVLAGPTPSTFQDELQGLINRHSKENDSNTPDFILASYLRDCLDTWGRHVRGRDTWYGVALRPGAPTVPVPQQLLAGLVRAAEILATRDPDGKIWDDDARRALEQCFVNGWALGKLEDPWVDPRDS